VVKNSKLLKKKLAAQVLGGSKPSCNKMSSQTSLKMLMFRCFL
jgi:hypothetical protein